MKEFNTWVEVLDYVEGNYANHLAFNALYSDQWQYLFPTKEFILRLIMLLVGLYDVGLRKGNRVGILAHPSPEWTMADMAIICCGGVVVPLFANISEENFLYTQFPNRSLK